MHKCDMPLICVSVHEWLTSLNGFVYREVSLDLAPLRLTFSETITHHLIVPMDEIKAFCDQQREWLEAELVASQQEATSSAASEEGRSRVLSGLSLTQVSVGLYGRTVVELGMPGNARLPAHRFTSGDEVELRGSDSKRRTTQGVVSQVTDTTLAFAVSSSGSSSKDGKNKKQSKQQQQEEDEQDEPYGEPPFTLVPSSSVEVHRKMVAALSSLAQHGAQHDVAGPVVKALVDPKTQSTAVLRSSNETIQDFRQRLSNPSLDDSQVEAIQFAL